MKSNCKDCKFKAAKFIKFCLMKEKIEHVCPEGLEVFKCKGYQKEDI